MTMACLLWPSLLLGQASAAMANQQKARATLAASIQALGGQAWLKVRTSRRRVRIASFFQGNPTGEVAEATILSEFPDHQRIDLDKGRVVQIFSGANGWEITYKGKKNLPPKMLEEHARWRKHSLRSVLGQWYGDPTTALFDEGPTQTERHPVEKIMLIHPESEGNGSDAVTLEIDVQSHLPVRVSFHWRDPEFHDRNVDAIEYDNYRRIDDIATPFTVTKTHNGEIVHQTYVVRIEYDIRPQKHAFDPDFAAAYVK